MNIKEELALDVPAGMLSKVSLVPPESEEWRISERIHQPHNTMWWLYKVHFNIYFSAQDTPIETTYISLAS